MRAIKDKELYYSRRRGKAPKGVCSVCGGKGKYKRTFKHKNPIITHCFDCRGTGKVEHRVMYIGKSDFDSGLVNKDFYTVISENEFDYVISIRGKELLQISKEEFKEE